MNKKEKKKVLLIGWDAADWKVINPLLDAGKMPNLERLVNEGVMGNLATLSPALSPMLWTSIATGKRPFKHGVLGFTEPNPNGTGIRPISNFSRKTRAIWNILQLNDMKSNVVGWWPSHPVEPINGVMVSNHYQRANAPVDKPWPMMSGTVHPKRLTKNLAGLRLHPGELSAEHIGPFVPDFGKIDQDKDRRLESLAKILAECTSIHAVATALIQLESWDFMAVYYDAIDHFGHGFMRYHPPRMDGVSEQDFELYKGVVEGGYHFHDMMLGVLMQLAGEETTIILISDHGFHPDHLRPAHIPVEPAGPAAQHREQGIIVMKGPGIKKDEIIHGASLLDITPTILHLYGLSVGEDMNGVPLVNAFTEPSEVATIPSWDEANGEDGSYPEDMVMDPIESKEAIQQLVDLGYIEKPDEDSEKAVANTVRELEYNLARSYMDGNRHYDALPLLERLTAESPEESRFAIQRLTCYQALGRTSDAGRALEEIFENKKKYAARARKELKQWREHHKETKPEELEDGEKHELRRLMSQAGENPYAMEFLTAAQRLAEGDAETALNHLNKAEKLNPQSAQVHFKKGEVYLHQKQWKEAGSSFRRALSLDMENSGSILGLCRSLLGRRLNAEAANQAMTAIGLAYFNPHAHFLLGVALHRMGRPLQAVEALKVAVLQNPNHVKALNRLAYIFEKRIKDSETAEEYGKRGAEAKQRVREIRAGKVKPQEEPQLRRVAMTSDQNILELDQKTPGKIITPLEETITIVSGLPRSGTSMMMQMLAAGGLSPIMDDQRPADQHNEKGYYEDARAKAVHRDTSWLPEVRGKAVKVVAQLLSRLPAGKGFNYGIIFMVRELKEVIASQREMLLVQGKDGARMPDSLLKQTFINQLRKIKKFLAIRKIPTIYVNHKECIQNPAAEAARINAFLGGRLDEAAMTSTVDPKLHRHKHNS